MKADPTHKPYLNQSFRMPCSSKIFTKQELESLKRFGVWMTSLIKGEIAPLTSKQKKFIRCIQQDVQPETFFELIYSKMLARVEYEKEDQASTKYRHFDKSEQWFPCYMWSRD